MTVSKEVLESIFAFDDMIRSFSIIGCDGRLIFAKMREGVKSNAPPETITEYSARAAIHASMNQLEEKDYGRVTTAVIVREKLVTMMFPSVGKIFVVSAQPSFPLEKVESIGRFIDSLAISA